MSSSYRVKTNRESPSSYGVVVKRPKTRPKVTPRTEAASPVTQAERVEWARARWRSAIGRSAAFRHADPALHAAVVARRAELDRELLALDRLTPKPS